MCIHWSEETAQFILIFSNLKENNESKVDACAPISKRLSFPSFVKSFVRQIHNLQPETLNVSFHACTWFLLKNKYLLRFAFHSNSCTLLRSNPFAAIIPITKQSVCFWFATYFFRIAKLIMLLHVFSFLSQVSTVSEESTLERLEETLEYVRELGAISEINPLFAWWFSFSFLRHTLAHKPTPQAWPNSPVEHVLHLMTEPALICMHFIVDKSLSEMEREALIYTTR